MKVPGLLIYSQMCFPVSIVKHGGGGLSRPQATGLYNFEQSKHGGGRVGVILGFGKDPGILKISLLGQDVSLLHL